MAILNLILNIFKESEREQMKTIIIPINVDSGLFHMLCFQLISDYSLLFDFSKCFSCKFIFDILN